MSDFDKYIKQGEPGHFQSGGENPHITQEALKTTIGKSISTVKRLTVSLQKKGLLVRKNGKRDGFWECTAREKN